MIFSKKNAGKWVASKNNRVLETGRTLSSLRKKMSTRKDNAEIVYDLVPKNSFFAGNCGN